MKIVSNRTLAAARHLDVDRYFSACNLPLGAYGSGRAWITILAVDTRTLDAIACSAQNLPRGWIAIAADNSETQSLYEAFLVSTKLPCLFYTRFFY